MSSPDVITDLALYCRYHLKDVIVGKIYFLLVRIKIKYMELGIVKRETTGAGELIGEFTMDTIAMPTCGKLLELIALFDTRGPFLLTWFN